MLLSLDYHLDLILDFETGPRPTNQEGNCPMPKQLRKIFAVRFTNKEVRFAPALLEKSGDLCCDLRFDRPIDFFGPDEDDRLRLRIIMLEPPDDSILQKVIGDTSYDLARVEKFPRNNGPLTYFVSFDEGVAGAVRTAYQAGLRYAETVLDRFTPCRIVARVESGRDVPGELRELSEESLFEYPRNDMTRMAFDKAVCVRIEEHRNDLEHFLRGNVLASFHTEGLAPVKGSL